MNQLSHARRVHVVKALIEGMSINGTVRMTGVAKNTVLKLLADLGSACLDYQDNVMVDLPCQRLECDEIWEFCYAKAKNVPVEHRGEFGYGDVWTWTAIDPVSKMVPCWYVGNRDGSAAWHFMNDLAARLSSRVQLTTDGLRLYLEAVESAFGGDIDYAQCIKVYGPGPDDERRYSPAQCLSMETRVISGKPDRRHIGTSIVERQNLTMRMSMRRFTRLTNGFSKKLENHMHAISLHFMQYNFARPHKSLSYPYPRTPAMAAGLADHVWSVDEIVELLSN